MSLRYQKRVNLGKGVGLNVSKSGVSASVRGKSGAIGTRGFSIKTGIPGLTFRSSWGKGGKGLVILAIAGLLMLALLILYNTGRFVLFAISRLYNSLTQNSK
jgi:hypothetical protein